MRLINVLGAPGLGKSTFGAGLFYEMKKLGYNVELVDEFAKFKVYEKNPKALRCQPYIFAQQLYKIMMTAEDVDYIITDSPIILSAIYNEDYPASFDRFVVDTFKMFDSENLLLTTDSERSYQETGRRHTAEQQDSLQKQIKELLDTNDIPYIQVDQYNDSILSILQLLTREKKDGPDTTVL